MADGKIKINRVFTKDTDLSGNPYVDAPLVVQNVTRGSTTTFAGLGFHNQGTVGAFLYLNHNGELMIWENNHTFKINMTQVT